MLQKLNRKDSKGIELYQEVKQLDWKGNLKKEYGAVGTLKELANTFLPSQRQAKRHPEPMVNKIHSNRKTTLGRLIGYLSIFTTLKNGGISVKRIKHIHETSSAIKRKIAVLEFMAICENKKKQWEERMVEKLKLYKTI